MIHRNLITMSQNQFGSSKHRFNFCSVCRSAGEISKLTFSLIHTHKQTHTYTPTGAVSVQGCSRQKERRNTQSPWSGGTWKRSVSEPGDGPVGDTTLSLQRSVYRSSLFPWRERIQVWVNCRLCDQVLISGWQTSPSTPRFNDLCIFSPHTFCHLRPVCLFFFGLSHQGVSAYCTEHQNVFRTCFILFKLCVLETVFQHT